MIGANRDGADGARHIQRNGGLVIAQEDAQFPEMPLTAMVTGCVDYVLPLDKIAATIIALAWCRARRHGCVSRAWPLPELSDEACFADLKHSASDQITGPRPPAVHLDSNAFASF